MTGSPHALSRLQRKEIMAALRRGTVPARGIEHLAVGLDRFEKAIDEELAMTALGHGHFKAVRGEYGAGKTFFTRWLQHRAQEAGFATSEVQVSENDTPLYRLETVYRRALESLKTREWRDGAFRHLLESWFFSLEEEVVAAGGATKDDAAGLALAVGELLERRLHEVSSTQPLFAMALRACHRARVRQDIGLFEGLMAWLMAQPHVAAEVKREADLKGDIDHFATMGFLRGLLTVLRQTGRKGLVLVLDEVETIQRVRADARERSLNALRQLVDDVHSGRFPGLYVLITGTPAFFDGSQGVRRLPPLEQRLHVDFAADARFDSARAIQIRLAPFDHEKLIAVGRTVRDLYPSEHPDRVRTLAGDDVLQDLARGVTGRLGGKVGVAPRLFLKKLVSEVLDRIDEHPDFDPRKHYQLVIQGAEMSAEEKASAGLGPDPDSIELP